MAESESSHHAPMDSLLDAMKESTKSVPIVPLSFESRHFPASSGGGKGSAIPSLQVGGGAGPSTLRKPLGFGTRVKEPVKEKNPFADESEGNPFLDADGSEAAKAKNPFEDEDDYDPSLNPFE